VLSVEREREEEIRERSLTQRRRGAKKKRARGVKRNAVAFADAPTLNT
jgi:hypothetical protein